MTTKSTRFVVALSVVLLGALGITTGSRDELAIRSDNPVSPFQQRVAEYTQLRQRIIDDLVDSGIHRAADDVQGGREFRHRLALAIRDARRQAQPGEVFCVEVAGRMRHMVWNALQGADDILSEAPWVTSVRVNDFYPEGEPLASVPPSLLTQLDPLPQELQYRFLANSLILLDVDAFLIVDYIPDAFERHFELTESTGNATSATGSSAVLRTSGIR
jgi:hypothetical protein